MVIPHAVIVVVPLIRSAGDQRFTGQRDSKQISAVRFGVRVLDPCHPVLPCAFPADGPHIAADKEELIATAPHYIVARGRKGGSNVAAAIVNSVLYQLVEREG